MAISANISIKDNLKPYLKKMQSIPVRKILTAIGDLELMQTKLRFRKEQAPDGTQWLKSQRVIKHGGKTLRKSGNLFNSIGRHVSKDFVEVGTNLKYAKPHQEGGKITVPGHVVRAHQRRRGGRIYFVRPYTVRPYQFDMPLRQIFGVNKKTYENIDKVLRRYLGKP